MYIFPIHDFLICHKLTTNSLLNILEESVQSFPKEFSQQLFQREVH